LQLVGALYIIALNIVMTSLILLLIKYVFRVPLRMPEDMLLVGDDAVHGEDAYTFSDFLESADTRRVRNLELGGVIPAESLPNDGENVQESAKKRG
jgi:ammonium transporter, Amt family